MSRQRPKFLIVIGLLMLMVFAGAASITTYKYITRAHNPLPAEVKTKLTFSPLIIPSNNYDFATSDYQLATTEDDTQLLTYTVTTTGMNRIHISEYPQPPQFTEIAEYKERFLNNVVQQYESVSTANGTIYLGRLAKQNNQQVGVMLERGLIMFMKPTQQMEKSAWRQLGDQFELQKID
jgi:hypothetical protein